MSANPNVGEWGINYNLNVNFNINGFTALTLSFTRPDGSTFTRLNGDVTVPAVPLVTDDMGTFAANEYCSYIVKVGDLTVDGEYLVRLAYTDASKHLVSDVASFEVSL